MILVQELAALLVLIAAGLVPTARLVPGRRAFVAAPLVGVAACGGGALLSLVIPAPPLVLAAAVVLVVHVVVLRLPAANGRSVVKGITRVMHAPPSGALVVVAGFGPQLFGTLTSATAFDARVTWFLHAEWLLGGQGMFLSEIKNRAWTHNPDYPPAVSASIAAVWKLLRTHDAELAQFIVAALTGFALSLAIVLILDLRATGAGARSITIERWIWPVVISAAAYAVIRDYGFNGYMDGFLACTALCLALLLFRGDSSPLLVGACAITAALTKNEGFVFVTIMAIGTTIYGPLRRLVRTPRLLALWAGVATGSAWIVLMRARGAVSWYSAGSVSSSLSGGADNASRAAIAAASVGKQVAGILVIFLGCFALSLVDRRSRRPRVFARTLATDGDDARTQVAGLLAIVAAGVSAVTVAYFVASSTPIRPFLAGSVDRVTMTPKLLLMAASAAVMPPLSVLRTKRVSAVVAGVLTVLVVGQGAREARSQLNPGALGRSAAVGRHYRCIERRVVAALPKGSQITVDAPYRWVQRIESMAYPRYRIVPNEPQRRPNARYVLKFTDKPGGCGTITVAGVGRASVARAV